jgi:hypothetical protein
MARKVTLSLVTLPGANEQSGASPLTLTGAGTTFSRAYGEFARALKALFALNISAVSGSSPTLDVVVQGYDEVSDVWYDMVTFGQQNAISSSPVTPIAADIYFRMYRAKFTVAGSSTPSFTFTLSVRAHGR